MSQALKQWLVLFFSLPGKREVANQSSVSFSNLFSFYWFIKFRSLETTASYNPKVISVKS